MHNSKVVAIGAGCAGIAAAAGARKAGAEVTLLERQDQLLGIGRIAGSMDVGGRYPLHLEIVERGGMMFNEVKTTRLYNIDEVDAEIITALDEDVRSTYTSLAKRVGVDQVTVRRRLDKLLESGLIRLGVLVDYSRIGPSLHVLFALNIRADSVDSVLEEVGKLPQVSWVTSVTGRFESIALARFSSYDELGEFIHKDLNHIKGILRSETFVFLRRQKSFYSPLEKSSKSSFLVT